jgi:histone H3/H4
MSVELPFAPVDEVIRRHAGDLRVSADAAAELATRIQSRGAALAADAAERAAVDGRKTLMASDFAAVGSGVRDEPLDPDAVALPIAPVDRIARLDIDDRYRVAMDARVTLARRLETYADEVATGAAALARHAGRRTIQAEDVETYCRLRDLRAEFERGNGSGSGGGSPPSPDGDTDADAVAEN